MFRVTVPALANLLLLRFFSTSFAGSSFAGSSFAGSSKLFTYSSFFFALTPLNCVFRYRSACAKLAPILIPSCSRKHSALPETGLFQ